MTIRKGLFWVHLFSGIAAGLVIAVMCLTGTALAFEKPIVAWAEREVRRVEPPAPGTDRLSLDELQRKFRQARPEERPSAIVVSTNPRDAVVFVVGRDGNCYADPFTGEIRQPSGTKMRDFMRLMTSLHRGLALAGDNRPIGQAITGACNLAFLFLALSGLVLWWPRKWRTKGLQRSLWFLRGATGRARDWNWHNVIGFWFLPVLIILTASGAVISYRWASDLVYRTAGEAPPAPGNPGGSSGPETQVFPPTAEAKPLGRDALLAAMLRDFPDAESVTFRLGGNGPPNGPTKDAPRGERSSPRAVIVVVKRPGVWPRTATTALTLDSFTGAVLNRETFSNFSAGRRARTWLRFLHTGEALGAGGQLVAGLACVGGCFLVYTGFALAWRRFFGEEKK